MDGFSIEMPNDLMRPGIDGHSPEVVEIPIRVLWTLAWAILATFALRKGRARVFTIGFVPFLGLVPRRIRGAPSGPDLFCVAFDQQELLLLEKLADHVFNGVVFSVFLELLDEIGLLLLLSYE